jgi:hypothetical protein
MIQSAKGVSSAMGLLVQCAHSTDGLIAALDAGADIIRSRDRAIIERCKHDIASRDDTLANQMTDVEKGYSLGLQDACDILDSVLREIS